MPQRRKRSAAITLVLAESLGGCGEPVPQRDVYASLADCQRDWAQAQQCEPVRDGRYSSGWFYGPSRYGGTWPSGRPKSSPNAVDAVMAPGSAPTRTASWRSWVSSSRFSFGGSRSSSTSRGGFGSSGRSSIS